MDINTTFSLVVEVESEKKTIRVDGIKSGGLYLPEPVERIWEVRYEMISYSWNLSWKLSL